jgi:hypothetical protein
MSELGRNDLIALSAGQTASLVRRSGAARLISDLIEETERVLKELANGAVASRTGIRGVASTEE